MKKFDTMKWSDIGPLVDEIGRHVHTIFLHCSASDRPNHDSAEVMDRWHKKRGWPEIGYHAFITKEGRLQMGRAWHKNPIAQKYHNVGSLALCTHGLEESKFTRKQLRAVKRTCTILVNAFQKSWGLEVKIRGHREVAAKACPVYDYKSLLNLDSKGYMRTDGESTPVTHTPQVYSGGTLRIFDRGQEVKLLQTALNKRNLGKALVVDGAFGRATDKRVRRFQARAGLHVDGIVGPNTWRALYG